jgi:hypothetical protein
LNVGAEGQRVFDDEQEWESDETREPLGKEGRNGYRMGLPGICAPFKEAVSTGITRTTETRANR